MFLSLRLPQPLLLEGEAGVGKTEAAKSLALVLETPLVRLQCYEGSMRPKRCTSGTIRASSSIRLADSRNTPLGEEELFGPTTSSAARSCARSSTGPRPAVLLVDEIDRADDDFEAFLLELLADASVTIPESTIRATHPPVIVLTSNRTRDLHDAVKRRCLYHRIEYPTPSAKWTSCVGASRARRRRSPSRLRTPSRACVRATCRSRRGSPRRSTGSRHSSLLGVERLDVATVDRTLGSVLKYSDDQEVVRAAGLELLVPGDD